MSLDAVLFDLDGTLLDTLEDLADCMNRVLERNGFPAHPLQAYRYYVGDGVENLVLRTLPEERREKDTVQSLKALMREEYGSHWADKTRPYEGIPQLLDALTQRRVRLAILSNKPDAFARSIVQHYFNRWSFEAVFGERDSHPRKPDPAAALEIARELNLAPERFLYLGDTKTDMQTALRAGMLAVGALWGFRSREELLQSGAQDLVAFPLEVLRFF